jgi:nitrate/nitrite-specific signal transduction histidine kinase
MGCGFEWQSTANASTGHYGLAQMQERAQEIRAHLSVSSIPGVGTKIETIVPVRA